MNIFLFSLGLLSLSHVRAELNTHSSYKAIIAFAYRQLIESNDSSVNTIRPLVAIGGTHVFWKGIVWTYFNLSGIKNTTKAYLVLPKELSIGRYSLGSVAVRSYDYNPKTERKRLILRTYHLTSSGPTPDTTRLDVGLHVSLGLHSQDNNNNNQLLFAVRTPKTRSGMMKSELLGRSVLLVYSYEGGDPFKPHIQAIINGSAARAAAIQELQASNRIKERASSRKERSPRPHACSRIDFPLSFAELGWANWIIWPLSYNAFTCTGTCTSKFIETNHAALRALLLDARAKQRTLGSPCCVPQSLKPMTMVYTDSSRNLIVKQLPDMIVEACKCY